MNEKEYRQLKELLRELEQKIDTLYENETEPPSSDQEPEPELKDASEPLFELEAEKTGNSRRLVCAHTTDLPLQTP